MIEKGAMIFVCGDGGGMAKAVIQAFQHVLVNEGKRTPEQAMKEIAEWMKEGRYAQDIWS